MPNQIELSLSSLLPTVSYLPPELISLSTSLLAQSRSKASSLKPEEEIGRTYACCHIACQRLGHKLALEIGKPAPPVKPKVYTKLHTYLNAVLTTTTTPRTPKAQRIVDRPQQERSSGRLARLGSSGQSLPVDDQSTAKTKTPPSRKRAAPSTAPKQDADGVPDFAKPIIRLVCKSSDDPAAIPHVFAGVSSILNHLNYVPDPKPKRPAKRRKVDEPSPVSYFDPIVVPTSITDDQISNLIIAVFVAVYSRTRGEWNIDEPDIADAAGKALRQYEEGREDVDWHYDNEGEMMREVQQFKKAVRGAWGQMEWWLNVPTLGRTMQEDLALQREKELEDANGYEGEGARPVMPAKRPAKTPLRRKEKHGNVEDDDVGAAGLLPGLGTMFQPAVDWLSEERQEDYVRWKRDVLRKVPTVA